MKNNELIADVNDLIEAGEFTTKENFVTLMAILITLFFHFVFTIVLHLGA
ncbi:MAG: hypothetical protein IH840_06600 [Candidatus Heimdallarchaeota archaeon]|nr:hypothetical protein [Candidatus Heimdallarchaeota archaeon]